MSRRVVESYEVDASVEALLAIDFESECASCSAPLPWGDRSARVGLAAGAWKPPGSKKFVGYLLCGGCVPRFKAEDASALERVERWCTHRGKLADLESARVMREIEGRR